MSFNFAKAMFRASTSFVNPLNIDIQAPEKTPRRSGRKTKPRTEAQKAARRARDQARKAQG